MSVLIPSFTGLRLVEEGLHWEEEKIVLIPSFTGLRLVPSALIARLILWGLNPFFYRSSVGHHTTL